MKMKRLLLTAVLSMAALFVTCSAVFASNAVVDSKTYTHPSKFSNSIVIDGIDVSLYQTNIDWQKVKRQGMDFAIIRCGFSYLASPHRQNVDDYFEQNYREARANDVMVGVYYYSTATTIKEAQKEAEYVLDLLDGRELDMPVVFDYEFAGRVATAYNSWDSSSRRSKITANALAFLNYIEKNSDYEAMFYSYRNMMDPSFSSNYKFYMDRIDNMYKVWEAQYSTDNSYSRPFEIWQYTSSGKVTGINGDTDCNFWYYDNAAEETKEGTLNIKDANVTLSKTSYEYTKFRKAPTPTVTYGGTTLQKGIDYDVHYIKNVLAGTAYVWIEGKGNYSNVKLVPFEITKTDIANGGTIDDIADVTYSGSEKKPAAKVMYTGTTLKKDVDYTVTYSNNTEVGTATVKITGMRNFYGTMTKTFKINKATPTFTGYSKYTRTPDRPDFTINTKSSNEDAKLTYKSSDTSIATVDSNGKVSLKGGIGTVTITVTSPSTKNYNAATKEVLIVVNPVEEEPEEPEVPDTPEESGIVSGVQNTTIKASSVLNDDSIEISWTKSAGYKMDYYEVFRSTTSGEYDDDPYFTTDDGTKTSYRNTGGLKKGTRYYYRVRGVRIIDGKTYYSQWSNQAYRLFNGSSDEESDNQGLISGVQNTTIKVSSVLNAKNIQINWTKSAGYKMDYYEVFRSTVSGKYDDEPYFTTKDGTKTSYKNTGGLKKGSRYYYRVRGVRTIDGQTYYSKWSNQAYRTYK